MKEVEKSCEVYIGHPRGVAVDFEGKTHRNEWVDFPIGLDEEIKAIRYSVKNGGSGGGTVVHYGHVEDLVGKSLTLVDAMFADPKQRDAFKTILKKEIYGWFDRLDQYGTFGPKNIEVQ